MFTIREFNFEQDTEKVTQLLKAEFGSQFSKDFFLWKHQQNPFGSSFGLVAVNESNEVIGVRLFLWWKFLINNEVKTAIRPVDTTTDKKYRGMGIFKKLTLQGIEELNGQYNFIFNTPNNNSLPGYLKMGWQVPKKQLYYYITLANPLSKMVNFKLIDEWEELPEFVLSSNAHTLLSPEFIKWRYNSDKYKKALFHGHNNGTLVIYKVVTKKIKSIAFKVLIVIDVIGELQNCHRLINSLCKFEKSSAYYFAGFGNTAKLKQPFSIKRGDSVVAFRSIDPEEGSAISFSTGDLEGVL